MQTKIQKWGNSLGLRIPRVVAKEAGVEMGSSVEVSIMNGDLIVKPVRRKKYRLDELLAKVTAKNIHEEIGTGKPVGREIW